MRFSFKFVTRKIGPLSHLNGFHVFPRDNIRKAFTSMHNPVFEHSVALLACIILRINGKQFRCSDFTFVQKKFYLITEKHSKNTRLKILSKNAAAFSIRISKSSRENNVNRCT